MISVIIPTMRLKRKKNIKYLYKSISSLPDVIKDLKENTKEEIEIILVVNGLEDQSLIKFVDELENVKIIKNNLNVGVARAWNMGRHFAEGEFLLYLNDDVRVASSAISEMKKTFESKEKVGIVGPKGAKWENCEHVEFVGENSIEEASAIAGFAFMVKTEIFDEIGGFDNAYTPAGFEEIDFCFKAIQAGYHCIVNPAIDITTEPRHGISALNTNIKYLNSEINTQDLNARNRDYFESKWKNHESN